MSDQSKTNKATKVTTSAEFDIIIDKTDNKNTVEWDSRLNPYPPTILKFADYILAYCIIKQDWILIENCV